jgi:hypothetical protein
VKINRLLGTRKDSEVQSIRLPQTEFGNALLEQKLSELIEIIEHSVIDSQSAKLYQQQIAEAFEKSETAEAQIASFEQLDQDNNLSREELLEGLEKLLSETKIDSKISSSYLKKNSFQKGIMFILSILLIVFGFAMIIMPAPPSFEMFTVFYFTPNDGVTIMDLISLLIIFGGVLLFVLNFNKK